MSNINTLINNAVKDIIFDKDYIVLIRDGCYTVISASDFLDYFVNGGEGVCDSVMNCWHVMGDFAGVHIDENGEGGECNFEYDTNPRIHFPKGEGIKIITSEEQAKVPDSIYILAKETGEELYYELIIVDEAGNKRKQKVPTGSGGTITGGENSGAGGIPIYQGENADKIKIASIKSISGSVAVSTDQGSVNLEVPVIGGENLDNTENIPDGRVNVFTGLGNKNLKFRGFQFTGLVTKDLGNGVIEVEYKEAADITIKTFFVNAGYAREDGNGSILRPYKKYVQALKAIIGSGTILNPEYPNAKIIVQTDVTISSADLALPEYAILEGRCTVNGMNVVSENNNYINYEGNVDYPFSSKFLNDKLASNPSYTGNVKITFDYVTLGSATVKGVLECETLSNNRSSSVFSRLTVNGVYKKGDNSVYIDSGQVLLGQPIKIQNTITNTTPTVSIKGFDSSQNGRCVVNEYLSITGTSQTFLQVRDTALPIPKLVLDCDPLNLSTDNMTTKTPKVGLYRLDVYNAWVNIDDFRSIGEVKDNIGGQDSLFRYFDDGSYAGANLFITSGYINHSTSNKILSLTAPVDKILSLKNCDFGARAKTLSPMGSFVNEQGTSQVRSIDAEGSNFHNVKETTISGIKMTSVLSYINGNMYTTQPPFSNPLSGPHTEAKTGGLIQGNIYYNFTTQSLTLIP